MIDSSEASETPSAIDSSSESAMCSWRAMARGLVPNFSLAAEVTAKRFRRAARGDRVVQPRRRRSSADSADGRPTPTPTPTPTHDATNNEFQRRAHGGRHVALRGVARGATPQLAARRRRRTCARSRAVAVASSDFQQLTAELLSAAKETDRDVWEQRNGQFQTLILAATLMFGVAMSAIIEGNFDAGAASPPARIAFAAFVALALSSLFLCLIACVLVSRRMSYYMIGRAVSFVDRLGHILWTANHMIAATTAERGAAARHAPVRCRGVGGARRRPRQLRRPAADAPLLAAVVVAAGLALVGVARGGGAGGRGVRGGGRARARSLADRRGRGRRRQLV